jgi:hypothetical protein
MEHKGRITSPLEAVTTELMKKQGIERISVVL